MLAPCDSPPLVPYSEQEPSPHRKYLCPSYADIAKPRKFQMKSTPSSLLRMTVSGQERAMGQKSDSLDFRGRALLEANDSTALQVTQTRQDQDTTFQRLMDSPGRKRQSSSPLVTFKSSTKVMIFP